MRTLRLHAVTMLAALGVLATGCAGTAGVSAVKVTTPAAAAAPAALPRATVAKPPCGTVATPAYKHVIWIWMENRTYTSVLGSGAAAPNLTAYARKCGLATADYAVTHPSLPNYVAATSGSVSGVIGDCEVATCPLAKSSLFGQVAAAHKTWRGYAESMPANCTLPSSGTYAARHNPAVYYTPIRSQCRSWDVPMGGATGAFQHALATATLPSFSFVTPNLCDDGHDCSTAHADSWLGTWLNRITASAAYHRADTLVFVTWDEGVGTDQHIATVVIGPSVHPGTRSATRFTHYSLLRTTEELLGLGRLRAAATARSMRSAFNL
jgi:phospholipase C